MTRDILSRPPLLLLDDVMSELDAARRTAFIAQIRGWCANGYHDDESRVFRYRNARAREGGDGRRRGACLRVAGERQGMASTSSMVDVERSRIIAGVTPEQRERMSEAERARTVSRAWNTVCAGTREGEHVDRVEVPARHQRAARVSRRFGMDARDDDASRDYPRAHGASGREDRQGSCSERPVRVTRRARPRGAWPHPAAVCPRRRPVQSSRKPRRARSRTRSRPSRTESFGNP